MHFIGKTAGVRTDQLRAPKDVQVDNSFSLLALMHKRRLAHEAHARASYLGERRRCLYSRRGCRSCVRRVRPVRAGADYLIDSVVLAATARDEKRGE